MVLRCFQCDGKHHFFSCDQLSQRFKNYLLRQQGELKAYKNVAVQSDRTIKQNTNGRGADRRLSGSASQHVRSKISNEKSHKHRIKNPSSKKFQQNSNQDLKNSNTILQTPTPNAKKSARTSSNRFQIVTPIKHESDGYENSAVRHRRVRTPSPKRCQSEEKSQNKEWETVKSKKQQKFEKQKSFQHDLVFSITNDIDKDQEIEGDFTINSQGTVTIRDAGRVEVDEMLKFGLEKLFGKKLKGCYDFGLELFQSEFNYGMFEVGASRTFINFMKKSKILENVPPELETGLNWRFMLEKEKNQKFVVDVGISEAFGEIFKYEDINWKCAINFT